MKHTEDLYIAGAMISLMKGHWVDALIILKSLYRGRNEKEVSSSDDGITSPN